MTPNKKPAMHRALGISKEIEDAAWFVLGPGLLGKASPLDGRTRTWSVAAASELLERLERGIPDPKAPMMTNLRENLEGATRGAKQLAVELLFLQSLPLAHEVKSLKVKRARVAEAASWLEPPLELPDELYAGMTDHGVIRDRTAEFNWTIWDHLKWLCRFVRHVAQRPAGVVQAALKDPLAFHELTVGTPEDQPAIRRSIEFLVWPGYFEPVVADVERQEIRDAFASLVGGAKGDSDEEVSADIHRIRLHLDEQAGQRIDWYSRQLVSQWRKVGDPGRRAWLLRSHHDNAELLAAWQDEEAVTLDVEHLRLLDPGVTAGLVQHAVDEDYKHLSYVEREDTKTAVFAFLTVMKPGDLTLYQNSGTVRVGVVLGEPEHHDDNRRLRRKVRWFDEVHSMAELPRHVQRQLASSGLIVDVTRVIQALETLLPAEAEAEPDDGAEPDAVVEPCEGFRPLTARIRRVPAHGPRTAAGNRRTAGGKPPAGPLRPARHRQDLPGQAPRRRTGRGHRRRAGQTGPVPPLLRLRGLLRGLPAGQDRRGPGVLQAGRRTAAPAGRGGRQAGQREQAVLPDHR